MAEKSIIFTPESVRSFAGRHENDSGGGIMLTNEQLQEIRERASVPRGYLDIYNGEYKYALVLAGVDVQTLLAHIATLDRALGLAVEELETYMPCPICPVSGECGGDLNMIGTPDCVSRLKEHFVRLAEREEGGGL